VYYFKRRRHKVVLAGADCTGHGVPGAFVSMLALHLFARLVEERGLTEPVSILEEMDFELQKAFAGSNRKLADGADAAVCTIDLRTLKMQFAGAMRPMYLVRDGRIVKLAPDRRGLGGMLHLIADFTPQYLQLQKNDALYFVSDGFIDQFGGPKNRKMNALIFSQTLLDAQEIPFEEQKEFFERTFRTWQGHYPQTDDVLLWGVKI
ncbi:MAG: serine/threonine-protein phosphatase, partial [Bacteroidia bacterium]|nr:serine/threonine-protein phosphatase [Bacteroidia bacterium]